MRNSVEKKDLILVVEDYVQNLQVLGQNLENAGYEIAIAKSGEEALEVLKTLHPDLILLDVMMPGMDGFETCTEIKKDPRTAEVPVIFLTAKSEPDDILEGFQCGAVDYVYKPFNSAELLARVKTHLELRRVKRELEAMNAGKDRFFSIISHDMKSALGTVVSLGRSLAEEATGEFQEDAMMLREGAESAYGLMENLLEWAAVQTGKVERYEEAVDVGEVFSNVLEGMQVLIRNRGLELHSEVEPGLSLYTDRHGVEMVVRNLLSNAIKFSKEGKRVWLRGCTEGGSVVIEVQDEGKGMGVELRDSLFTGRVASEGGSGIGLSLCYELLELSGGAISVESSLGEGSLFRCQFPVKQEVLAGSR